MDRLSPIETINERVAVMKLWCDLINYPPSRFFIASADPMPQPRSKRRATARGVKLEERKVLSERKNLNGEGS
jgi:hypothetical protein